MLMRSMNEALHQPVAARSGDHIGANHAETAMPSSNRRAQPVMGLKGEAP